MDQWLSLRQQLKETFRAKLRKQTGGATTASGDKENAAPSYNYDGNFFGRSEIIFTGKAIEEANLWSQRNPKFLNEKVVVSKKLMIKNDKKSGVQSKMEKVILDPIRKEQKVEWLKDSRDYSFLSSDNCDQIPVPGNKSRFPELIVQGVKDIIKTENKTKNSRVSTTERVDDMKKENQATKSGLSKIQRVADIKTGSKAKNSKFSEIQGVKGANISRPEKKQVFGELKKPLETRKQIIDSRKEVKPVSKQEIKKRTPCSKSDGRKRKLEQRRGAEVNEEMKAISIIRNMFGYDPTKFCDDKDDLNMESTFADIQKEERRSAKIAKKEDEVEELLQKKSRNSKK